jgi:hypothetical protein
MFLALPGFLQAMVFNGQESGHIRSSFDRRPSPGNKLHAEIYRRIITERRAQNNHEIVRNATGTGKACPAAES